MKFYSYIKSVKVLLLLHLFIIVGCKKLIEVDPPFTSINTENIFKDDVLATAVLTGIYANLSSDNVIYAPNTLAGISLLGALSSDELKAFNIGNEISSYYLNNPQPAKDREVGPWENIYSYILSTNLAIEGLTDNKVLSQSVQKQLLGEAKVIRAFCYFYLVNLYGTAPIIISSDYERGRLLERATAANIYAQIEEDLLNARILLGKNYLASDLKTIVNDGRRFRPNYWVATALLSRTYLHLERWEDAEVMASEIIDNNNGLFELVELNNVFKKGSREAIWQLDDVSIFNTGESIFIPQNDSTRNVYYLDEDLYNSFDIQDERKLSWVGTQNYKSGGIIIAVYHFPSKYKAGPQQAFERSECPMVLRLAEQHLIRAEARAHLQKDFDAQVDLNMIRTRAGVPQSTATGEVLLNAIYNERRLELFTEWGNRWLDIKRTNHIDSVMSTAALKKGGEWASYKQFFPISNDELQRGINLQQTPGY